jgi:hypothetical protein
VYRRALNGGFPPLSGIISRLTWENFQPFPGKGLRGKDVADFPTNSHAA